jgi:DNA replicative helicase MCM subunit Mcm2 (Cdc46/Mcm family)
LNVVEKNVRLGKFRAIANSAGKEVKIGEGDKLFLKRYVRDARKIKVKISDKLLGKLSPDLIPLVKASAQMELRRKVSSIDVERILSLKL